MKVTRVLNLHPCLIPNSYRIYQMFSDLCLLGLSSSPLLCPALSFVGTALNVIKNSMSSLI